MKVKTPQTGGIVQSVQGRDSGSYYVIAAVDGNKLSLVNGRERKLENPKIKNVKHVRLMPQNVCEAGISYPWDKAFDTRVARLIKQLGCAEKS